MSSDFAPELQAHEYGPTPEDSAHRSLDAAMARTDSPASGEVAAVVDVTAPGVGVGLADRVSALADDLLAFNPGHGDFLTAGKRLRALLDTTPALPVDAEASLRLAISDPNATTPRRPNEHLTDWIARAVLASNWLAARDADLTARAEARGAAAGRDALLGDDAIEAATRAVWNHFYDGGQVRRYGVKEWPPPEQHMPWWRGIAEAALTAAASYTRDGMDGEADHG